MITRLYANDFRCLVAFEAVFDSFGVLCGRNGAGKSSVFDALRLLRNLGCGDGLLGSTGEQDVPRLELTHWLGSTVQEFEISRTQLVCLCEGSKGRSIDEVFIDRLIKRTNPKRVRG